MIPELRARPAHRPGQRRAMVPPFASEVTTSDCWNRGFESLVQLRVWGRIVASPFARCDARLSSP